MKRIPFFLVGVVLLSTWLTAGSHPGAKVARAQEIQRIAAIVNEDIISMYDLLARLEFVLVTSQLPNTEDTRRRLVPQVLRGLIDEQLQLQEAKRLNLTVSQPELDQAVANLEQQNNIPPGSLGEFLARANLQKSTVLAQVKAGFAWQKVVAQRIRPRVRISEEEIDEVLRQISRNQGNVQFLLSEIFLAVDTPDEEISVGETAERLSKQVRDGANFGALARQFSQSGSAGSDGDVGWVQGGQIDVTLEQALSGMRPGQVSEPIRTRTGFYILRLRQQRRFAAKPPQDRSVTIHQIHLKHPVDASADNILAQKDLAQTISSTARGCIDMVKLGKELGVTESTGPTKLKVKDLAEEIRPYALELATGEPSAPISKKDGFSVIMVCERDLAANLPDRNKVRQNLARDRLNVLMRRYLRDLRLGAFLEVRV